MAAGGSTSDEHTKFFWAAADVPSSHDLAILRPATLPKGKRFETLEDAEAYSSQLESSLRHGTRHSPLADTLKECRAGYYTFCPLCARLFRRWLFSESSRIASRQHAPAVVINAFFEVRSLGDLGSVNPHRLKDRLRNQMNRAGLSAAMALGGIEAGYKDGKWILHGHVLTLGADQSALSRFQKLYKGVEGVAKPLVIQPVADPTKQRSYLLKFHTYTRPTKSGWAYPLKPAAAQELAAWLNGYAFEDFLFLKRLRRRGAELTPC